MLSRSIDLRWFILLIGGLGYVFLTPIFEAQDEPSHFLRAYGLTEGQWIIKDHPKKVMEYVRKVLEKRYTPEQVPILQELNRRLQMEGDRIPHLIFNTAQYPPMPYLLHAAVIKLTTLGGVTEGALTRSIFACRLASLGLFIGLFLWVGRRSPALSWPFFWVASAPMCLSQASVIGVDTLLLMALALILVASFERLSLGAYFFLMTGGVFFLVTTKPPYAPLVLLPFVSLILVRQESRLWKLCILGGGLLMAVMTLLVWNYVMAAMGILSATVKVIQQYKHPAIDPHKQLAFMMAHPGQFMEIVIHTLKISTFTFFHQFVGVLGWLTLPVPLWTVYAWGGGAFAMLVISPPFTSFSRFTAFIMGGGCWVAGLLSGFLIFVSMYMIWEPVGAPAIHAQGRYFHPIAVVLLSGLIMLKKRELNPIWRQNIHLLLYSTAFLINGAALWTLFAKYSGPGFLSH